MTSITVTAVVLATLPADAVLFVELVERPARLDRERDAT